MLVVVVAVFGVCWLPLHAFMLVVDFNPQLTDYKTPAQKRFFTAIYYCVHWLAMSNSFVGAVVPSLSPEGCRGRRLHCGTAALSCRSAAAGRDVSMRPADQSCSCLDAKLLVSVSFRSRLGLGLGLGRNLSLIFSLGLSLSSVSRITALLRTCPPDRPRPRSPDPRALIINNALGSGWPCRTVSSTRSSTAFSTTASGQVVFIFKLLTCFVRQ